MAPRAQTAHQQADYLLARFVRQARDRTPEDEPFELHDHGSLVSLGKHRTVGNLMGSVFRSSWFVEGLFARTVYASLHLMHHRAVMGVVRTGVLAAARFLVKRTRPMVKLHRMGRRAIVVIGPGRWRVRSCEIHTRQDTEAVSDHPSPSTPPSVNAPESVPFPGEAIGAGPEAGATRRRRSPARRRARPAARRR